MSSGINAFQMQKTHKNSAPVQTANKQSTTIYKQTIHAFSIVLIAISLILSLPAIKASAQATPPAKKTHIIDRAHFFKNFRKQFYPIKEKEKYLIDRYERLFTYWDSKPHLKDLRWLAYILATTYHETGRKIKAVRECYGKTDQASINCVTRLYRRGRIKRNYAKVDKKTGKSYFGRGHVQLTWAFNYKRMGKELGLKDKVYINPDLALHPDTSVAIMSEGMIKGIFTGKRLSNYFNSKSTNWGGARRIINGMDKYKQIGSYGRKFYATLRMIPSGIPTTDGPAIATCDSQTIAQSCLSKLKSELALLKGQYEDQNNNYLTSLAENKTLIEKVASLSAEIKDLKAEQPDTFNELVSLKNAHKDLERRYNKSVKDNQTNLDEKIRLSALNTDLQTKLDDAITTGATGTDNLLKIRLAELKQSQTELNSKLAAATNDQTRLNTLANTLTARENTLNDQITDIEISRSALQARETNLLNAQEQLTKEEQLFTEQLQDLNLKEARLQRFEKDLADEKRTLEEFYSKNWFSRMWDKAASTWRSK